eukprot:gene13759-16227_t
MTNIEKLEKYILDFFSTRYPDIDFVYKVTHRDRHHGVYLLEKGASLMDFIISIHGNVEEELVAPKLIPEKFVTPEKLFKFLASFKDYLNSHQDLLDINNKGLDTNDIVVRVQKIKDDLVSMIDYAKQVYEMEDTMIPYQELRYCLITKNVPKFIDTLKSILASVSYAITKVHEGYFHSNVHLVLKLLGFEIISEESTNNGRIDAVIRFMDIIYIIEFKFEDGKDASKTALQQIKDKKYVQKFLIEHKEIVGIGVSFDKKDRNINGFMDEYLEELRNNVLKFKEEKLKKYKDDIFNTPAYNAELKAGHIYDNFLTIRVIEELLESAIGILSLVNGGTHNMVKREMRYLVELVTKYVVIDYELMGKKFEDKVKYLKTDIPSSSIEVILRYNPPFDDTISVQFRNEVKDYFYKASKIQKEFGDSVMPILLGLDHADAILMKNKGINFLKALLEEVEKEGKKNKYHALGADEFTYVTSRMDDNAKQQLNDLTNKYLDARKAIDNN